MNMLGWSLLEISYHHYPHLVPGTRTFLPQIVQCILIGEILHTDTASYFNVWMLFCSTYVLNEAETKQRNDNKTTQLIRAEQKRAEYSRLERSTAEQSRERHGTELQDRPEQCRAQNKWLVFNLSNMVYIGQINIYISGDMYTYTNTVSEYTVYIL